MGIASLEELAEASSTGNPRAFNGLVEQTSDGLYRLACRVTGSTAAGADVLQEAYLKAFAGLRRKELKSGTSVLAWLRRIVLHEALNARRSELRGEARAQAALRNEVDALEQVQAALELKELFEWMKALPDEQCAALVLRSLEGLSTRETSEVLGCSEGAVEQRLVRARVTLKERSRDE